MADYLSRLDFVNLDELGDPPFAQAVRLTPLPSR